jgi:hypothetical protein
LETYTVHRAFIASPGDVAAERQLSEEIIGSINRSIRDTLAVNIDARKWEHLAPVATDLPEEQLQDKLNREVEKCNFFILILYKRYGTIHSGHAISNTEREIETILKLHEQKPNRKILSYFRDIEANTDPGVQEEKVRDLRKRLEKKGLAYRTYRDPIEFSKYLTHDLYDVLLRIRLSPFKKQALKRFWRFGETIRTNQPRVAIVYPPVERHSTALGTDTDYWIKRLINSVAFEDYKAIQKIESNINLIGDIHYRVYPHTNVPPDIPSMNRIWLCVARNKIGLQELKKIKGLRFSFPSSTERPHHILWKTISGRNIKVQSPMAIYLEKQRRNMDISGDWNAQLGRIIAKDYAVIARIRREPSGEEEFLWDYYFAGIRGLGTWGAAWFVDREYKKFFACSEDQNIELLLEVTYRDNRILQVVDVSNNPASYFTSENNSRVIEGHIKSYK